MPRTRPATRRRPAPPAEPSPRRCRTPARGMTCGRHARPASAGEGGPVRRSADGDVPGEGHRRGARAALEGDADRDAVAAGTEQLGQDGGPSLQDLQCVLAHLTTVNRDAYLADVGAFEQYL